MARVKFSERSVIMMICLLVLIFFNRCIYVGALFMAMDEKKTIGKWKTGKYKTRIQSRRGWAGPAIYNCKIKTKRMGGLFYQTIVRETFSGYMYTTCIARFPINKKDTIVVDLCKEKTFDLNN